MESSDRYSASSRRHEESDRVWRGRRHWFGSHGTAETWAQLRVDRRSGDCGLSLLFYARTIFELRFLESSSPEPDLGSNQFSSGTLSVETGTRLKELEALPLPRTITITWRGMLTILLRASWSLGCLCFLSFVVWRRFSIEIPIWLTSLLLVVLILAEIGAFRTMSSGAKTSSERGRNRRKGYDAS